MGVRRGLPSCSGAVAGEMMVPHCPPRALPKAGGRQRPPCLTRVPDPQGWYSGCKTAGPEGTEQAGILRVPEGSIY